MKKQELFDKYSIDESHNVWESIDSLMSVEGYRVMHLSLIHISEPTRPY